MKNDQIEEIKSRIPLQSFLTSQYGLEFKGKQALCPFHPRDSNTPSLTIYEDKKYYCFSCRAHGDIFAFVTAHENIDFKAALEKLAAIAGVELPSRNSITKETVERILTIAVDFYHQNLFASENSRYLETLSREQD